MNIGIISRGLLQRKHKRVNTLNTMYQCRETLVDNIEKPLLLVGHTVSHLAITYYNDENWMDTSRVVSAERQKFLNFYSQVHLNTYTLSQPELFTAIFSPDTFQLDEFDALIIVRFDCFFKKHPFWSNFSKRPEDITVPWIEVGSNKRNRRLPDTIHIIHKPAEISHRIYNSLTSYFTPKRLKKVKEKKKGQRLMGIHDIGNTLMSHNLKVDHILNIRRGTGGKNPFYFFVKEDVNGDLSDWRSTAK